MSERSRKQLDEMFGVMTAQERAVHILQAWKADRDEEPLVRATTPRDQEGVLSELLSMARRVNREFATLALVHEQTAEKLRLKFAWLQSMRAWALNTQSLAHALLLLAPEPMTESEQDRRLAEMRDEMFSLEEAAQYLADTEEEDGGPGAWEKALSAAIKAGELKAQGKGRGLRIRYGDLCDWRGDTVPLIPEWGYEVEVLPDDEHEEVDRRRTHLASARRVLQRSPSFLASLGPPDEHLSEDAAGANRVALGLVTTLQEELPALWRDVRALELCIEEVRERLGGEDPPDEAVRNAIETAKVTIEELVEGLAGCDVPVELNEPEEAALDRLRELLKDAVEGESRW